MPAGTVIDRYYVGQGNLYLFERDAAGKRINGRAVGNAPQIQFSGQQQELSHRESRTGLRKKDNKIIWEPEVKCSITVDNFSKENLAWIFGGTASSVNSGTATAEVQSYAPIMQLNNFPITNPSAVTARKSGAGADWATNTYSVSKGGVVTILTDPPAAGVALGNSIEFNYAYSASERVDGMNAPNKEFWVSAEVVNKADNDNLVLLNLFRVKFMANFQFDLIGTDYGTLAVEGEILLDSFQPVSTGQLFSEQMVPQS